MIEELDGVGAFGGIYLLSIRIPACARMTVMG